MAERPAQVIAVDADGASLRATAECSDCTGCGGRCGLFMSDSRGEVHLSMQCFERAPLAGDRVLLVLPDRWLARAAFGGYGLPLLGLLLGAAGGQALAGLAAWPGDLPALAGAALGTLAALTLSKTDEPRIAVRFPADAAEDAAAQPGTAAPPPGAR